MTNKFYFIDPVSKPRMTQRDKWKKRPATSKYWEFKDKIKEHKVTVPECGAHVTFYIAIPKSWSKKKKLQFDGEPHQQKPDIDNLIKALLDAVYEDDAHIWNISATKLWSIDGGIEIVT